MSAAVVLMAYGSPERLADVPAYYADIRGGRPVAPELLDDLVERYRRLGIEDSSPLNAITEQTRAALELDLELPVFTGMKHWAPRIPDAAGAPAWSFSFQSESPTGEPWLGPDILDHLRALDAKRVLLCPVGFVSDHLEIRWDLDVEAAELAAELGIELVRIEMPNDDPAFV